LQNNEFDDDDDDDDDDIAREIRNLFVRTNILKIMFHKCTLAIKLTSFIRLNAIVCVFTISVYGVNILLGP